MPANRTPLRVHVLRSLDRKMNAPLTVPTRTRVSTLFVGLFLAAFLWAMKRDLPQTRTRFSGQLQLVGVAARVHGHAGGLAIQAHAELTAPGRVDALVE